MRQRDIVPPERLAETRATVVGVGAIGRQVALQLAGMGVPWLQLIDPDAVELANLACQGYFEDDVGRSKVDATTRLGRQINPAAEIIAIASRFQRSRESGNAVFVWVDSIETRRLIRDAVKDRLAFLADGRMTAEVLRVLVTCAPVSRRYYPSTLFAASEAYAGSWTAQSTIFCANVAAGLMLVQFSRWLRRMPVDADLSLNLLSYELASTAGDPVHSSRG
jgi:sulfur carrier protein ThiS adenylyltransferase